MKHVVLAVLLTFVLCSGFICTPPERVAYDTVVAAKAFTDSVKLKHEECNASVMPLSTSGVCGALRKAIAAKDALIDAVEVYCAGPTFNGGGACSPPTKGTPASVQAIAKINAAIASYNQTEIDLKVVIK